MKTGHTLALVSLALLAGCDSDSIDQTPGNLLNITADNRARVDTSVLNVTSNFEFAYEQFLEGGFKSTIEGADGTGSFIEDCVQGTEQTTLAGEGFDQDTGELSANGRIEWTAALHNCRIEFSGNWQGWYGISYGNADISLEWSGFDNATEQFDSLTFEARSNRRGYEEFTPEDNIDYFWEYHGVQKSTTDDSQYSNHFDLVYRSSHLNYKGIVIKTITPVTGSTDNDFPSAGELLVSGDGDSQVRYTVVPNGIEVQLNNEQATLLTWEDLEDL